MALSNCACCGQPGRRMRHRCSHGNWCPGRNVKPGSLQHHQRCPICAARAMVGQPPNFVEPPLPGWLTAGKVLRTRAELDAACGTAYPCFLGNESNECLGCVNLQSCYEKNPVQASGLARVEPPPRRCR